MATLTVEKIKGKHKNGKWFTATVDSIEVIQGIIYFRCGFNRYPASMVIIMK